MLWAKSDFSDGVVVRHFNCQYTFCVQVSKTEVKKTLHFNLDIQDIRARTEGATRNTALQAVSITGAVLSMVGAALTVITMLGFKLVMCDVYMKAIYTVAIYCLVNSDRNNQVHQRIHALLYANSVASHPVSTANFFLRHAKLGSGDSERGY